jgi:hypothetical protein
MAGTIARSPWLGSFTLTDSTSRKLSDILISSTFVATASQPLMASKPRCQYLLIGNDIGNGGANLFVGNEGLTTAFFGAKLVAGQFVPYYSMDTNLILLDQIWLLTDTNPTVVTINMITR